VNVTRVAKILAAPAALAALVIGGIFVGPQVFASSPQPRDWVSNNELDQIRTVADHFKVAGSDSRYVPITDNAGISCIADPGGMGAMGIHYLNPSFLGDGMIMPDEPEAAVYEPSPNGALHLVALEYIVDKATWDATHAGPPELFAGHPFDETGAPNRFNLDPFYSQHVWIGKGNPLGNLAMWNPAVTCD
jgi:hypothetical protein